MNKTLAFLLGVIVVGGGALLAVYSGVFNPTEPQPVTGIATTPAPEAAAPKANAPEKAAAPAKNAQEEAAAAKADLSKADLSKTDLSKTGPANSATADSAATQGDGAASDDKPQTVEAGGKEVVVPSFDVLRVEPSGSLVVAGKAAPDSKVDIIAGATPLGSTKAEPNGDFAAVLDNALTPGDHQLVLRSTAADGTAATSTETAVVSIPEKKDGQVLALVEKPGEPSRLITKPKAVEPAAASSETSGEAASAPSSPASSAGSSTKEVASAQPAEQPNAGKAPAATEPKASAPTPAAPEKPAEAQAEQPQSGNTAQEAAPAASESSAGPAQQAAAPAASASDGAGQDAAPAAASGAGSPATAQPRKTAEQQGAPAPGDQDAKAGVSVEAVEIDGSHVYVAGQATPGKRVLVYANDILLGAADVSEAGRFLVDTQHDLPVGDYIIRADLVGPNGMKVVARAAVPFAREAGDRIAAVAPSINPAGQAASPSGQETAAPKAAEAAPQKAEAPAAQAETAAQDSTAKTAVEAPAAPKEEPAQAASSEPSGAQPAAQAEPETKADTKEASASPASAGGQPKETLAAPLQEVQGSVIIRRGDTLWTIADRTYGRGVRYTTIYLANKAQIRDPDKIWPGQVFNMPQSSIPDSEALKVHRELH